MEYQETAKEHQINSIDFQEAILERQASMKCQGASMQYKEAFYMARETWEKRGIKQQCHHSNSKKKYEDNTVRASAHSDWYYTPFENFGEQVDVVLECKKKEQALLKYRKDFGTN